MTSRDAQIIDLCLRMCATQEEQAVLLDRDPHTPDGGPNHPQYEALLAEYAALSIKLTKAPPPITPEGREALARLALTLAPRTSEGKLSPHTFADWLLLFALTSAAGKPEAIPLEPDYLPNYWPTE